MIYTITLVVITTLSVIGSILMQLVYFKNKQLQSFCNTIQLYIVMGSSIYSFLDCVIVYSIQIYNWVALFYDILQYDFICNIVSYLSVYGILGVIGWSTALIHIMKQAVLRRKKEQLAKHLKIVAVAFSFPVLLVLFPLLINRPIYGFNQQVCWLKYHETTDNHSDAVIILICFYVPAILLSLLQINDLRLAMKKINMMRQSNMIFKGHIKHIKAIHSLWGYPIFYLFVWSIPTILYIIELGSVYVDSEFVFELFRILQSLITLVIFGICSQNMQFRVAFIALFHKSVQPAIHVDLFEPLEEFDQIQSHKTSKQHSID